VEENEPVNILDVPGHRRFRFGGARDTESTECEMLPFRVTHRKTVDEANRRERSNAQNAEETPSLHTLA
jgi:hypothetical protein